MTIARQRSRAASSRLFVGLLAFSALAWDDAPTANHSTLDRVLKRGELRVGTTGDYEPFTLRNPASKSYHGVDVDMAHALAESLGVRLRLVATTWSNLIRDLEDDEFDIGMGGISISLERQKRVFFSGPYHVGGKTAIARCVDLHRYDSLAAIDRPGVRLIVNPGGTNQAFVDRTIKKAKVIVHADNTTTFDELIAGRADVMITDKIEVELQTRKNPELCRVSQTAQFTYAEKGYLLPRGDIVFKAYVDQWLHLTRKRGMLKEFFDRWLYNIAVTLP